MNLGYSGYIRLSFCQRQHSMANYGVKYYKYQLSLQALNVTFPIELTDFVGVGIRMVKHPPIMSENERGNLVPSEPYEKRRIENP